MEPVDPSDKEADKFGLSLPRMLLNGFSVIFAAITLAPMGFFAATGKLHLFARPSVIAFWLLFLLAAMGGSYASKRYGGTELSILLTIVVIGLSVGNFGGCMTALGKWPQ